MEDLWLAFEGGGTKTRILLARPDGPILTSETGSCSNGIYIEPESYRVEMSQRLKRIAQLAEDAGGRVTVAGLAGPMDRDLVVELITRAFGAIEMVTAGEAQIALACHGLTVGLSVVAGTGSNCTAYDAQGRHFTTGGFGPQFDDLGSAYWIGREAIAAVVRGEDGRGMPTVLKERLFSYAEIADVWHIHRLCDRNGHLPRRYVAEFTPYVFEAARSGDEPALDVCRRAGDVLADLAVGAARRAGMLWPMVPLVPSGGVFHGADVILPSLGERARTLGVELDVYPPVLEPAPGIFKVIEFTRQGSDTRVS